MAAVEAWFEGGPIDGRIMAVETTAEGLLPDMIKVPQTGMYVGTSDVPAPIVDHHYLRVDGLADEVVYQYQGSRRAL